MSIETLDDILEELADKIGVYGACADGCEGTCRNHFVSNLRQRLDRAFEIGRKLSGESE